MCLSTVDRLVWCCLLPTTGHSLWPGCASQPAAHTDPYRHRGHTSSAGAQRGQTPRGLADSPGKSDGGRAELETAGKLRQRQLWFPERSAHLMRDSCGFYGTEWYTPKSQLLLNLTATSAEAFSFSLTGTAWGCCTGNPLTPEDWPTPEEEMPFSCLSGSPPLPNLLNLLYDSTILYLQWQKFFVWLVLIPNLLFKPWD